jgi:hypothetical protein
VDLLSQVYLLFGKKAMIIPWNDQSIRVIQAGSDIPHHQCSLEEYVERLFFKQGKDTLVKILLAHNVEPQDFISSTAWMSQNRTRI